MARRVACWEQLAGGFSNPEMEASAEVVRQAAPMFWSGFAVDEVLGGCAPNFGPGPEAGEWSCEHFMLRINEWGLAADTLKALLRLPESGELIREQLEEFRRDYERPEELPPQRAFRTKLATRLRFHIGAMVHRLCFHSWPLLPILDRRQLDLLYNVPAGMLLEARLEEDLLTSRFPRPGRNPLAGNSINLTVNSRGLDRIPLVWPAAESLRRKARRCTGGAGRRASRGAITATTI